MALIKKMDVSRIYPYFLDPRQQGDPSLPATGESLLACLKQHILLYERVVIQDNFLISELLLNAREQPGTASPLPPWIEAGWVQVAARSSTLRDIRGQLAALAEIGRYTPFEGKERGLSLYASTELASFLTDIDSALQITDAYVRWDPTELGQRYESALKHAAEHETFPGLPNEVALGVVKRVSQRGSHSRTEYYKASRSRQFRSYGSRIRRWADRHYLRNLPGKLDIGVSLPSQASRASGMVDPLSKGALRTEIRDELTSRGRDCLLFDRRFILDLTFAQVERLRGPEFTKWRAAAETGNAEAMANTLLVYFSMIGQSAPALVSPELESLEAKIRILEVAGDLSKFAALAIETAKSFMPATIMKVIEKDKVRLVREANAMLGGRQLEVIEPGVAEFCHKTLRRLPTG